MDDKGIVTQKMFTFVMLNIRLGTKQLSSSNRHSLTVNSSSRKLQIWIRKAQAVQFSQGSCSSIPYLHVSNGFQPGLA